MKEELYMSDRMKKGIRKAAFIVGGMALGLAYYYFVGCKTGGCGITSNPVMTTLYMGVTASGR